MQTQLVGQKLINSKGQSFAADEILKDKMVITVWNTIKAPSLILK